MIRYELTCAHGHGFEAWFRDSAAYDAQAAAGLVGCAVCGATEVRKALMAPAIRPSRAAAAGAAGERAAGPVPGPARAAEDARPSLSAPPGSEAAAALAALRTRIESSADYVGPRFAEEARRIHLGDAESRAIWGEATGAEARALVEDGVPVAPLPWLARRDD
jgi:hypothetical protein